MQDIIALSRDAWNATKKDHQPVYDDLIEDYRNMLSQQARGAIEGQIHDGALSAFESYVHKRFQSDEIPAEVKEELAEEVAAKDATKEKEHLDLKGPLPKDFTKIDLLHAAGINTYGQLLKVEDLTSIDGIGPALAKEIAKRLKADEKTLNK